MLGNLKLPVFRGKHYTVHGGPFIEVPDDAIGVKMAKEIAIPCDIDIPTVDFSTPPLHVLDRGLVKAVDAIVSGHPVYVGCMAGRGRTGLFMAILAKAFGIPDPVEYVRKHYYSHAVETSGQYRFVQDYEIPEVVRNKIKRAKIKSIFRFKKSLTRKLKD